MSAIRFDRVSLQFPGNLRPAVQDCSASIDSGEFVVILDPSGCGKTTLLKRVNRLYEPTSGRIWLGDRDLRSFPVTQLRRQIGYAIQQAGLFPHMTVAQNVAVVLKLLGWSRSQYQARVSELLALMGLAPEEFRDRYPAQLSGGQQQRVGLACALAADPALLLMDEPFGALDAIAREALQREVARLQRHLSKTILFVSHDVEEALRLADRILILRQGRVVQFDTPHAILTRPVDGFVRELVGADDRLRQLSVLTVKQAMTAWPGDRDLPREPSIAHHESLRQALSKLLHAGAPALTVLDEDRPVGVLSLERIRDYSRAVVDA